MRSRFICFHLAEAINELEPKHKPILELNVASKKRVTFLAILSTQLQILMLPVGYISS